jgi:hypothetical protein
VQIVKGVQDTHQRGLIQELTMQMGDIDIFFGAENLDLEPPQTVAPPFIQTTLHQNAISSRFAYREWWTGDSIFHNGSFLLVLFQTNLPGSWENGLA